MPVYFIISFLLAQLISVTLVCGQIPSPEKVIGFQVGADYKIADYTQITDYLKLLDEKSERVQMRQIGTTVLGKPLYLLCISSAENLKNLEKWRAISEKLSRAHISEKEAQKLSLEGKAVVWIDGGIHSTEKAATQFPPELAYMVATEETPEMRKIRDNVIFLLMPNINPDGLDIVADWYKKYLGTPYETTNPPVLYHYYVGHDDNRDWFMNTQPETRAVNQVLYHEWYPQIVHNQHQTSPAWARIFVPPFDKPANPNIHPGVVAGVNMVGNAMTQRFATNNMPGVVSGIRYTMWWNGGLRTAPYFHNQIGILTETAHATPTPRYYPPDSIPKNLRGGVPTNGTAINYPDPWKGGESHFRDAVEYMLTAAMATLSIGADMKEKWLYNIYAMGRDAIEDENSAFAYIIPSSQWDAGEASNLVNILMQGGIEVHQADKNFEVNNKTYEAGSFIIYGAQAFRPFVKDLLEKQVYPDIRTSPDGPPKTPYDLAGWTLPLQMGVTVVPIENDFKANAKILTEKVNPQPGNVSGNADFGYALSPRENISTIAVNRLLNQNEQVFWASKDFSDFEEGSIIVKKNSNTENNIRSLAKELGIDFTGVADTPSALFSIKEPKIGLYKSWAANMDEGWTRWLLDQYEFVYDTLHDADIHNRKLSQYDAIIIPDQHPPHILHGHGPNRMPEEYTGGMGLEGTLALEEYVKQGGTLITFDEASDFAIEQFGLPVKNVTKGLSAKQFFIPGSLIRTKVKNQHPLAYGMQTEVAASFNQSRAFEVVEQDRKGEGGNENIQHGPQPPVEVIASYAKDNLLMSGWALGEDKYLANKAAMLRVRHGSGNVILFGFRPQFRGQPRGTYKLIFNSIFSGTIQNFPEVKPETVIGEE